MLRLLLTYSTDISKGSVLPYKPDELEIHRQEIRQQFMAIHLNNKRKLKEFAYRK
jgi:hypothetical protein